MQNFEVTIDRIEGNKAILKLENNETIIWPKNNLPPNSKEGSVYFITLKDLKEKEGSNKELAKNILNEILDTDDIS